jgi:hypothetical protein
MPFLSFEQSMTLLLIENERLFVSDAQFLVLVLIRGCLYLWLFDWYLILDIRRAMPYAAGPPWQSIARRRLGVPLHLSHSHLKRFCSAKKGKRKKEKAERKKEKGKER